MIKNLLTKIARYFTNPCPEDVDQATATAVGEWLTLTDTTYPF